MTGVGLLDFAKNSAQYLLAHVAWLVVFLAIGFVALFAFRWIKVKQIEKKFGERITDSWKIAMPSAKSSQEFGHFFYLYLILVAMIVIVPVAICDVVFDLHLLK